MTTSAAAPTLPRRNRRAGAVAALGVALMVATGCSAGPQEPTPDPGGTAPAEIGRAHV